MKQSSFCCRLKKKKLYVVLEVKENLPLCVQIPELVFSQTLASRGKKSPQRGRRQCKHTLLHPAVHEVALTF
jgi:hypothetical protein